MLTILERLARRSVEDSDCVIWTGSCNQKGYGQLKVDGRIVLVHRAAWTARHGPIPEGMFVLHTCDRPPCWRDEHLWLGTTGDNLRDMAAKGRHPCQQRTHCPQNHPYDEANTYAWRGMRLCRACRAIREQRRSSK